MFYLLTTYTPICIIEIEIEIPVWVYERGIPVKKTVEKLEGLLELGGVKKDITLLVLSGIALLLSFAKVHLPFEPVWRADHFRGRHRACDRV